MKKLFLIPVLIVLLTLAVGVWAQEEQMAPPPPPGPQMMGEFPVPPMMPRMERMLNLSEDQISKISDYRLQLKKEMLPLRSELIQKQNELKLLITADKPDRGKINSTLEAISKIRMKMQQKRVEHQLKVRSLLSPEQKKKFDLMILEGKKGRGHGRPGPKMGKPLPHGKMGPRMK